MSVKPTSSQKHWWHDPVVLLLVTPLNSVQINKLFIFGLVILISSTCWRLYIFYKYFVIGGSHELPGSTILLLWLHWWPMIVASCQRRMKTCIGLFSVSGKEATTAVIHLLITSEFFVVKIGKGRQLCVCLSLSGILTVFHVRNIHLWFWNFVHNHWHKQTISG